MLMRIYSTLLGVLLVGAVSPELTAADLTGKVVLQGTPKPERTIDMAADPRCGALHDKPVTTRHYVVAPDGGLANVLVFVKSGLTEKNFPMPTEVPVLDQVGCEYMPFVAKLLICVWVAQYGI